ncbi:hypothetical protein WV31_10625 [Magnetospirillum sp. ME-1]|uniref:hypothetical protein n=1 Tax=Magnetospirillum sp. ME-1 TaxID=1639348 RepID=UPI000A17E70F|nr:hypothetical protein [Magnetospirillum sp. ME-1]ARJ66082.1 hypothetical protein WV31_10625 [Magnetospirillum sp. ME-1]
MKTGKPSAEEINDRAKLLMHSIGIHINGTHQQEDRMKIINTAGIVLDRDVVRNVVAIGCDEILDKHHDIMASIDVGRPVMRKFDPAAIVPPTPEQREFIRTTLAGIKAATRKSAR